MKLDHDEVVVAIPAGAMLPVACREALEAYATRPILRRINVGVIFVIGASRVVEIETLLTTGQVPFNRLSTL